MFKQKMKEILELFENKKFDEAIKQLNQIIENSNLISSDLANVYFFQGLAFQQQGQLEKAIEAYSVITRENNAKAYVQAQLKLGDLYEDQGNPDKAIEVWSQIIREDDAEVYAQVQFNIGNVYHAQENLDKAIETWSIIIREDDAEVYAQVQFNIGIVYQEQGKLDKALEAWSQIIREDDAKEYAQAQFNLGVVYQEQGNKDKAIEAWSQITREDNAETYVQAQFNISSAYYDQKNLEKAIEVLSQITRKDDAETYAQAQFNISVAYQEQGKLEKAIEAWSKITRKDDAETYAQAQFNLGVVYQEQSELDKAIEAWSQITREDNAELYVQAQFNLGNAYQEQGKLDKAIEAWSVITREDDTETYTQAQFNIGLAYQEQSELDKAIDVWSQITRKDDAKAYAKAQFNLGLAYQEQGKLDKAVDAWSQITQEDDTNAYTHAKFNIGLVYQKQGKLDKAINAWEKIERNDIKYGLSYIVENIIQISTNLEIKDLENRKKLIKILLSTEIIIEKLWVKDEKAIAHYTTLTVSKLLLSVGKSESNEVKPKSLFRLNTIRLMNDPEEGRLLNPLIGLANEKEAKNIAFISSFTLHHDSLNQFRLYGKEDDKEASGVSLILSKDFFATKHDTSSICSMQSFKKVKSTVENESNATYPLYRCIYLDPDSGFFKIAHREEWSFYREIVETNIKDKTKNTDLIREKEEAKETWGKYLNGIVKIEEEIEKELQILIDHITQIQASLKSNTMENKEVLVIEQILAEILLPLRFLIKHISFREEQECRILRIVDPKDSAIQYHSQINRLYLEYEPYILEHLEKIYLAPKAKDEKEIYEHLCIRGRDQLGIKKDNDVRVKISRHPFR